MPTAVDIPPAFYPTQSANSYPVPLDPHNFLRSQAPFADWRAVLYAAQQEGKQLSPELQAHAYEEGRLFLLRGEEIMAAEAFRAAGNYQDAFNEYQNILGGLRSNAYPQPSPQSEALALELYRRQLLLYKTADPEPIPASISWSDIVRQSGSQQLSLSESTIWLLYNAETPGLLSWPIEGSPQAIQNMLTIPSTAQSIIFQTQDQQTAIAFSDGSSVQINNAENGDMLKYWKGSGGSGGKIELLDVSADMRYALIVKHLSVDDYVFKVHLASETMQELGAMPAGARFKISADGSIVVAHQSEGNLLIWAGSRTITISANGDPVYDFAIAPNSARVAFIRQDGAVRLLDLNLGRLYWVTELTEKPSGALTFNADGTKIAVAGQKRIWLLSLANGMLIRHAETKGLSIRQLAFSADSRTLVAEDTGNNVMTWSLNR